MDEVLILGEHDRLGLASCLEDRVVFRVAQPEIADGDCFYAARLVEPLDQVGRKLGVDPQLQAATTG